MKVATLLVIFAGMSVVDASYTAAACHAVCDTTTNYLTAGAGETTSYKTYTDKIATETNMAQKLGEFYHDVADWCTTQKTALDKCLKKGAVNAACKDGENVGTPFEAIPNTCGCADLKKDCKDWHDAVADVVEAAKHDTDLVTHCKLAKRKKHREGALKCLNTAKKCDIPLGADPTSTALQIGQLGIHAHEECLCTNDKALDKVTAWFTKHWKVTTEDADDCKKKDADAWKDAAAMKTWWDAQDKKCKADVITGLGMFCTEGAQHGADDYRKTACTETAMDVALTATDKPFWKDLNLHGVDNKAIRDQIVKDACEYKRPKKADKGSGAFSVSVMGILAVTVFSQVV